MGRPGPKPRPRPPKRIGTRGPRPQPAALRLLKGNPGKRPIKPEPKISHLYAPPPDYLDADARAEWSTIGPELVKLELLGRLDHTAFAFYCGLVSLFKKELRLLMADHQAAAMDIQIGAGMTSLSRTPSARRRALDYLAQLKVLWGRFGLTPADRTALAGADQKPEDDWAGAAGLDG